ncbi:MAG: sensor histidine kinase KdpD [Chloroflexi bacterium]|nr:sensor histidine kinase KdpD [Chloroflexota bacterium]
MTQRHDDSRPSPEKFLSRLLREEQQGKRGRLRIYLGMAPGVGKTYAMLMEAHRRKAQGVDVVIGLVETYGRAKTQEAIGDLPIIPRKQVTYQGVTLEEMDTEAVIARRPQLVLVDELAHTNVPGSKWEKRWMDVEEILKTGLSVFTTVNIQHLESLADVVESITGAPVRERLPDHVVDKADEIQLVDMAPGALRQRIQEGSVYPGERAQQALRQFFREGNLTALRELSLRRVATTAEKDLEQYMRDHQVEAVWPAGDRVLVCIDPHAHGQHLLRRGWQMAKGFQSDLIALFVEEPSWAKASPEERRVLAENLRFAEDLGARVLRVQGSDVAATITKVAREENIGNIVIGFGQKSSLLDMTKTSTLQKLLRLATDIDIHAVPLKRQD